MAEKIICRCITIKPVDGIYFLHDIHKMKKFRAFVASLISFWNAFGVYKNATLAMFFLMSLSAAIESIGLSMVVPILSGVLKGEVRDLIPRGMLWLFDNQDKLQVSVFLVVLIVGLVILQQFIKLVNTSFSTYVLCGIRDMWRLRMFERFIFSKINKSSGMSAGENMESILNQSVRASKFMRYMLDAFSDLILFIFLVVASVVVSWKITVSIGVILLIFFVFSVSHLKQHSRELGRRENKISHALSSITSEMITGITHIRIFAMERYWIDEFSTISRKLSKNQLIFSIFNQLPSFIGVVVMSFIILSVVVYYYDEDTITLLGTLVLIAQRMQVGLSSLMKQLSNAYNSKPSFDAMMKIDNSFSRKNSGVIEPQYPINHVRLSQLTYSYPGSSRSVLNGLDMDFYRGQVTLIMGASGTGKTTLINLLCDLLAPSSGEILIDGVSLEGINESAWLSQLAVVNQHNLIFRTSLMDNLMMANPNASQSRLEYATCASGVDLFANQLEDGYDTILSNNPVTLSGGQIQKLGVARALLRDAQLFIFDEPTSALDDVSQAKVLSAIRSLADNGKMVILISHRSECKPIADKIIHLPTSS